MISLAKPLDQARFQITPFASGLSFPTSMLELADGSILVAINNGSSLFSSSSAQLQRLADNDGNGIADGAATTLAANLPGLVTSIRRLDDIIVALSAKAGQEAITLLRTGASANSPISTIGSLRFSFPAGFEQTTYAIALRRSPFDHQGLEVFFNLGAKSNSLSTTERVGLQGDNANISLDPVLLEADSIHRIRLTPSTNGNSLTATVDLIARGLRNAAGMIFSPDGNLYLQDNGIDGNPREVSLSADELNRIRSQDIGQIIPNFGFPGVYTDYITGAIISSDPKTTEPIISFTPLDGRRSEGLTELALAPPGFGDSFKTGVFASFIGMVGRGGINNHENPIIFADPSTGEYYHFIPNQQLGNPYGLATTSNSLYISDISSTGNLAANTKGVIYRISTSEPPPPADNPTINLSVSPELAREDDGANLIFTFKRIGNTAGQLEVKYTVGGTASVQTDYSGIGDTSATRTVLFEEGSDTAVLAINPVADADFEPDETVILTLIVSPNYNIGATSSVKGTIQNDDRQTGAVTAITDNVGTIQGAIAEGAFSNDSTPTLSGSLSASLASGERLSIYRNGSLAGYAQVSGTSWSFTPSSAIAASGLQSFSAAVVDGAGNVGASSAARSFSFNPSAENTWSYNWASASPLGTTPGLLLARVSLPSPRSGEPNLKLTALRVDLTTPGLRLTATGPSADWQANTRETVTSTTRGFVSTSRQEGTPVVAAINTAFFTLTNGSQAVPTNLKGLAVRDSLLVSPAENGFSALLVDPITGARIEQISSISGVDPTSLQLAVSGGQFAEGVVLRDGIPSGDSLTQNAHSALGLSQDRRYLTMLTVDRELRDLTPSYYGATLRDVGTILAGMGSHTGMNLDGGGSTQMAWWNPTSGSSELLNAPLGGVERFVGSNLGVTYQPIGAV